MEEKKLKLLRMSNIPVSIDVFCRDLLAELSKDYEVVVVSSPEKELECIRKREGVRTIGVRIERRISPLKDLKTLLRLIKIFKHEKPDIVHTMNPKAGLLGMMAARYSGVRFRVHSFTGLVFPQAKGIKKYILKTTDRITCRCATHILPEGNGVRKDLLFNKITSKPLRVLGYGNIRGIDIKYYSPDNSEIQSEASALARKDMFTFIFVGRIAKDKGIGELVEAFLRLADRRKDIRLFILGVDEPDDRPSAKILEAIKHSPQIEATGGVSDVRPYMKASDCLILPSYREGFPNSVIEGGAMGLPCVVTDINGSNEIISNGVNGLIVPVKDAEALCCAMNKVMEDRQLYERMRTNARPMVIHRFDRSLVWNSLKDFYREIAETI